MCTYPWCVHALHNCLRPMGQSRGTCACEVPDSHLWCSGLLEREETLGIIQAMNPQTGLGHTLPQLNQKSSAFILSCLCFLM